MQSLPPLLEITGLQKGFPGVIALDSVDLKVDTGEVHALIGHNGAGKSTLIKILTGAYRADGGEIRLGGDIVSISSPAHARALGIHAVYQELNLLPQMTVAENIFLGQEPTSARRIRHGEIRAKTSELLSGLGLEVSPDRRVAELGVGAQQLVELARALVRTARLLVMDEPSSALSEREIAVLFRTVRSLAERGVSIIYVSHRLSEISAVCHRATILRAGKRVGTVDVRNTSRLSLIEMMVGHAVPPAAISDAAPLGDEILRVEHLRAAPSLHDVSFSVRRGEIVGIAGLMGSGRTRLAHILFGAARPEAGSIYVQGRRVTFRSPHDAAALGIALVPENRKEHGLVPLMSVTANLTLAALDLVTRMGRIRRRHERRLAKRLSQDLDIRAPRMERPVGVLSGGNQQKVVLGKWLAKGARLFLFDEPTRGLDIKAKTEILGLISRLAREDRAGVLFISSELGEVLDMADRVLVLRDGHVVREYVRGEATEALVVHELLETA